jgi:hypothetical protein
MALLLLLLTITVSVALLLLLLTMALDSLVLTSLLLLDRNLLLLATLAGYQLVLATSKYNSHKLSN